MKKTIFILECTDNHGEFQPRGNNYHHTRGDAVSHMETNIACDKKNRIERKWRVMPYVRQEVIS